MLISQACSEGSVWDTASTDVRKDLSVYAPAQISSPPDMLFNQTAILSNGHVIVESLNNHDPQHSIKGG